MGVDRTRQAHARIPLDARLQRRVRGEDIVDRRRVGIKVEQPPDAGQQHGQVLQVLHCDRDVEASGRASGLEPAFPARQPDQTGVTGRVRYLDPCYGAGRQESEDAVVVRGPRGQCQAQGGRCAGSRGSMRQEAAAVPELGGGEVIHLLDGLVELADAVEARCECHIGKRHVGGRKQRPRRLRTGGSRQGERSGAELGLKDPTELPG